MAVLANRAWMSTATVGTGTITLGSALSGYQSFADAGITNSQTVSYTAIDGAAWEVGTGVYTSAGTTLTRVVNESSNADAAISLSGSATVFITARKEDIVTPAASSTDNAAARFDGTNGRDLQNSALIIADTTGALSRSGNGGIPIQGTNTNDSAAAGDVGEVISSSIATGSAVGLATNVASPIANVALTAGDWDVSIILHFNMAATTNVTYIIGSITTSNNSVDLTAGRFVAESFGPGVVLGNAVSPTIVLANVRISLTATTTYYMIAQPGFTVSTAAAWGIISARRVR